MSEIVARYELPVEIFLPHTAQVKAREALNAAWSWTPKSARDEPPKELENALSRLHETVIMTIRVDVDKDGIKTIRV